MLKTRPVMAPATREGNTRKLERLEDLQGQVKELEIKLTKAHEGGQYEFLKMAEAISLWRKIRKELGRWMDRVAWMHPDRPPPSLKTETSVPTLAQVHLYRSALEKLEKETIEEHKQQRVGAWERRLKKSWTRGGKEAFSWVRGEVRGD